VGVQANGVAKMAGAQDLPVWPGSGAAPGVLIGRPEAGIEPVSRRNASNSDFHASVAAENAVSIILYGGS
jgi:hypothetical protein